MTYIGIDPGKTGAFAIIDEDGLVNVFPWDTDYFVYKMELLCEEDRIACLEKVHYMKGQGGSSGFNFAINFGIIQGILIAEKVPYQLVIPQVWKREFSIPMGEKYTKAQKKQFDIDACKRLFPDVSLRRTDRSRTDDDNMADALLMALYAKRRF